MSYGLESNRRSDRVSLTSVVYRVTDSMLSKRDEHTTNTRQA